MDYKPEAPTSLDEVNENRNGVLPPRKRGVFNTLYPPGPKPGAKGRMKNHCRKFWWCDLLVFAIIVLIIILPVIYVAIPKKAQSDVNKSTLEVTSQEVTNPSPNGIHLKLASVARSSSSFHPRLGAFQAALSLEGQEPFIHIDIPSVKANAVTDINLEQDVQFANLDAFIEYNKVVMGSETFQVHLDGKTTVHLSGLPTMDVDYNKVLTMKGLNKLKGLNITDLRILSGRNEILPDGSNMVGTVVIPNPSVMTIELGNVTMNLAVAGEPIGTSLLPNLILRPGENRVPMQSTVDQLKVITMVQDTYHDAVIPLEITGNSSVSSTGEHLTYFEAAIQPNTILVNLNLQPALSAIGINVTQFS
ncbi:hypothetical protein BS50DRAFT_113493 [Corynespora cassiicola Philippines]|uniref:Uncharacterized protein n=1 Tax=Corynespora cassiicola Philippines TaxID=1448308 RepID=A0A2T2NDE2_CORCC|nr:hypothetical protein BS50DRAFT_113493 [Corynespora cassiicola Philippines]